MRFWTSDLHFWHSNILKYCPNRPYDTVERMNEGIVANWNSLVKQEDTVYIVGDFSLAFRPVELYAKRLLGEKILILGNHDWAYPAHKKSRTPENRQKWIDKYLGAGFDEVVVEKKLLLENGQMVLMNHLPYLEPNSGQDQRYHEFRPIDRGLALICGHVHQHWVTRRSSTGSVMLNVGVDVWNMRPVSEQVIIDQLRDAEFSRNEET